VPGYQRISTPESYFGANGKVYALVYGEKQSLPGEQQKHLRVPLVLVYDDKAMLTDVVPIDPTLDPISIGAFANGDLLVLSEDTQQVVMTESYVSLTAMPWLTRVQALPAPRKS
jgi:hypothetical protein